MNKNRLHLPQCLSYSYFLIFFSLSACEFRSVIDASSVNSEPEIPPTPSSNDTVNDSKKDGGEIPSEIAWLSYLEKKRLGLWEGNVGPQKGIPDSEEMEVCVEIGPTTMEGDSIRLTKASDVNAAIQQCPAGQVIQLKAGTYKFQKPIEFGYRGSLVLRGEGRNTILNFSGSSPSGNIGVLRPGQPWIPQSKLLSVSNWISGFEQGSDTIELEDLGSLETKDWLWLDQLNDEDVGHAGIAYEGCSNCGRENATRSQISMHQITEIIRENGKNFLKINPPLQMPNWRLSQKPQAFWVENMSRNIGVESLLIDGTDSYPTSNYWRPNILFAYCANCWVKNIVSVNNFIEPYHSGSSHVVFYYSTKGAVVNSDFFGTRGAYSGSYGVLLSNSSNVLVENNSFDSIAGPVVIGTGSVVNVVAYNYAVKMNAHMSGYMGAAYLSHDAGANMNLFEGNYGNQIRADMFHGSAIYNMVFRNRLTGWEKQMTGNLFPLVIDTQNPYWSSIANILGTDSEDFKHTSYATIVGVEGADTPQHIYRIGLSTHRDFAHDPHTGKSFYKNGDYDFFNKKTIWEDIDDADKTPPSLYRSKKPDWFGDNEWPPFDVEKIENAGPEQLPAYQRYMEKN